MREQTLVRRLVSGFLTASMALSLITTTGISASASEDEARAAMPLSRTALSNRADSRPILSKEPGGGSIPMPMALDQSFLVFAEGSDTAEVTAYMTDLQYLGLLTWEEYAAFIPASVSLDRVEYLTHDQRQYIAGLTESQRLSLRAQAEAKLQLEDQFIWDAVLGDIDDSEKLAFAPKSWTIYDATETSAPMMACTVEVSWTGERPVNRVEAPTAGLSDSDLAALLSQTGETAESGSKSIYDESPEVQEFLRQMYQEGGLTQENSPYDLSVFDNGSNGGFNLMGTSASTEGGEEAAPLETEGTGESDGLESTATPDGQENGGEEVREPAEETISAEAEEEAGTEDLPEEGETLSAAGEENVPVAAEDDGSVIIDENDVPLAQEPEEDAEEEPRKEEPTEAVFRVRLKANENIMAGGSAFYMPTTETVPAPAPQQKDEEKDEQNTQDSTDEKDDAEMAEKTDGENADTTEDGEDAAEADGTEGNGEDAVTDGTEDDGQAAEGETQPEDSQAPTEDEPEAGEAPTADEAGAAENNETVLPPEMIVESNAMTFTSAPMAAALPMGASGGLVRMYAGETETLSPADFGLANIARAFVLDNRIATAAVVGGQVQVTAPLAKEGRTKLIVMDSANRMRIRVLEVIGLYTKSSAEGSAPDKKFAIPMVSTYSNHVLALKADGTVSGWGESSDGQLGSEYNSGSEGLPRTIYVGGAPMKDIVMVATGLNHSMALTADGKIYAWGSNNAGQIGTNNSSDTIVRTPSLVRNCSGDAGTALGDIVAIAAGGSFSLALDKDGNVYAWGSDDRGQLGQGPASTGESLRYPHLVTGISKRIIQISAGGAFVVALAEDGTVYSWGENRGGQLGAELSEGVTPMSAIPVEVWSPSNTGKVAGTPVDIAAGGQAVASVGSDGTIDHQGHAHMITATPGVSLTTSVYSWGAGIDGSLGIGKDINTNFPNQVQMPELAQNVVSLSVGFHHSVAVTSDGVAYAWGSNISHQMGQGGEVTSQGDKKSSNIITMYRSGVPVHN